MTRPALDILVVEDEMLVALHLEQMLEEMGHSVRLAGRVEDGLAALTARAPDFAILDVNIGGELSFPIADLLNARAIPYAFATGYGNRLLPEDHAAAPVLTKPFARTDLEALLAASLRR